MNIKSLSIGVSLSILSAVSLANPLPMHMSSSANFLFGSIQPDPPGAKPKLTYYGGPVLQNVKIYAIYWGPGVDATVKANIADFYKGIVTTGYTDWLSEYNTTGVTTVNGKPSMNQTIGRGTFMGEINMTPINKTMNIKDSEIRVEIEAQIAAGKLPTPDDNTLFMFHLPPGMMVLYDTLNSGYNCQDWCAYHSDYHRAAFNGQYVAYGIIPDYSGACSQGCGPSDTFTNLCGGTSHEVIEAITDPLGDDTGAGKAGWPMAWWWDGGTANSQGEIGDVCAYNSPDGKVTGPSGKVFDVQGEWSNSRNTCYAGPYGVAGQ